MKKLLLSLFAAAAMVSCSDNASTSKPENTLRFQNGTFKIAQFTDIHWGNNVADTLDNRKMIETVVAEEQPQLIVLTGDNVTDAPDLETAKAYWQQVIGILEGTGLPYAIVMGNHDAESCDSINADILEEWLCQMTTRCLNYPTTSSCYGHGNRALEILSEHTDSVAAVAYVIDSNDYPQDPTLAEHSSYDWIHRDQIEWYEAESERITAQNGGRALPALAFFHICVPEFDIAGNDENVFGHFLETTCPAGINSGFFASAYIHRDIMGMFVGHDHTNDFCGIHRGIALCYGRQSGVEALHEETPRGARIIELREGRRAFDTWVRTESGKEATWYFPLGMNSDMERNPLPAVEAGDVTPGVNYTYYEGTDERSTTAMLVEKNKKDSGLTTNFDITRAPAEDHFGYDFEAYFLAEETGAYGFRLLSDDGSVLLLDHQLLIDNDGSHSTQKKLVYVALEKGLHHMQIKYFENYMGQNLQLNMMTRNVDEQPVPDRLLFVPTKQ